MPLLDKKYNGNGGLWRVYNNPKIAGQGSIQIGGRKIALTLWHNKRGGSAPDFNITVNEQKTTHDDVVWFRSLQPSPTGSWQEQTKAIVGRKADIVIVDDLTPDNALIDAARGRDPVDDDIPF